MAKPKSLLRYHRWLALAFAPFLLVQATTGAALLFREPLTRLLAPASASAGGAVPVSLISRSAHEAWPDMRVTRIFMPPDETSLALARLEGADRTVRYAAIDPGTGAVLRKGAIWAFPMEAVLHIHYQLNAGNTGLLIVSLNGFVLVLIATTGVWQWWPGPGRIGKTLAATPRLPKRMRLRGWHRSVGAVVCLVLGTSGMTGILLSAPDLSFSQAVQVAPPSPLTLTDPQIDSAIAIAREAYPDAQVRDIRFGPDGNLAVNLRAPRGGVRAVDVVRISGRDGQVLANVPYEQSEELWQTVMPIHTGDISEPVGRYLMLAAAATLLFLVVSGPLTWLRARKKGKPSR
ncbi:PepSY-associated TM helix domain-containing protein [Altererythrobacter sp.]|uniref:PepSY-associated TM helix domain-containing protein n=1 Tax=Altererythrobacter sp. TaxID=1872480 RepID=UPI003D123EB3